MKPNSSANTAWRNRCSESAGIAAFGWKAHGLAHHPAGADRQQALHQLVAIAHRVLPGVEERHHPQPLVFIDLMLAVPRAPPAMAVPSRPRQRRPAPSPPSVEPIRAAVDRFGCLRISSSSPPKLPSHSSADRCWVDSRGEQIGGLQHHKGFDQLRVGSAVAPAPASGWRRSRWCPSPGWRRSLAAHPQPRAPHLRAWRGWC